LISAKGGYPVHKLDRVIIPQRGSIVKRWKRLRSIRRAMRVQMRRERRGGRIRNPGNLIGTNDDQLRPMEWCQTEGSEKKILNDAIHTHGTIWNKQPAEETDFECSSRCGLLTDEDRSFAFTPGFQKAEGKDLVYWDVCLRHRSG